MTSHHAPRLDKKVFSVDDGPEILSKYLSVLDDEAERILSLPIEKRTSQDINNVIRASTFLTTMNKEARAEVNQIKLEVRREFASAPPSLPKEYDPLPAFQVANLLEEAKKGSQ